MSRKSFLLRIDEQLLNAISRWAADDLRSVNGQIEFILRNALRDAKRDTTGTNKPPESAGPDASPPPSPDD